MENETVIVTLPLKDYEKMKEQIKELQEQVKQKTIVEYILPPVYAYITLLLMIGFLVWIIRDMIRMHMFDF